MVNHKRWWVWTVGYGRLGMDGRPEDLRKVLQERGINANGIVQKQMVAILSSHHDFLKVVTSFGYRILISSKFHCEFNPLSVSGTRQK